MNVMAPAQSSFEEARRRHLIEATVEAVADVGFKAASLSQIARRANVSTGLYAHYFRDKDGLLEATLRFLAARLAAALRQRLRTATTPRERLLAVVDAALGDQEFDRRTSAVWLVFWGQIAHSDRFQRIQYAYQRRLHTNLRHAFRACVPADRAEPCATIVAGLIDGLWLQSHAYRGGASADQARATVHDVVFMLIESSARPGADRSPVAPARRAVVASRDRASAPDSKLVERARQAATLWTAKCPRDRAAVLLRCAQLVAAHGPSLARLDAAASGRPVLTGIEFFIPRCVAAFEAAAERARGPASIRHELGDGVSGTEIAVCSGVARAEAYRSAPLLDLCRAVADALIGGRSLVVDIPHAARAVAAEVEGLLVQAGVPPGSVGVHVRDDGEAEDAGAPQNAAIILKGADIGRAIETVLAARGPGRRTPDARDVVVFVDKAVLRAAETAANGWSRETGGAGRPAGATVVPLRDLEADQSADRDASTLRLVGFDTDDALLAMLERLGFGTVAIFSDNDRRADRIARAVPAPYCSINAYDLGHAEAADRFRAWVPSGLRPAVTRRLLTFADARA